MILFIITVSNNRKIVKRLRRRSAKIAINIRTSYTIFKDQVRKELSIPEFINIYNYFINRVDNAN